MTQGVADLLQCASAESRNLLRDVERFAARLTLCNWGQPELLQALLRHEPPLLFALGASAGAVAALQADVEKAIARAPRLSGEFALLFDPLPATDVPATLAGARQIALERGGDAFEPADIVEAIAGDCSSETGALLRAAGVTAQLLPTDTGKWRPIPLDRVPSLSAFAVDLTQQAVQGKLDPVIWREEEMRRVANILCRRTKNNAVLVGDAGTGKTAIVEGVAQRIVAGNVPRPLRDARIFAVDLGLLVAGSTLRGEFEGRLVALLKEARDGGRQIILFFDEFHTIVGAGGSEGALDAANMLKPALARGEITIVAATTWEEYARNVERDRALERRLSPVFVREPTEAETVAMLRGIRPRLEAHHGVTIADDAIGAAVALSIRHMAERRLPDKAIDLLDEGCASLRHGIEAGATGATGTLSTSLPVLNAPGIAAVLGVPPGAALDLQGRSSAAEVHRTLSSRVVGQERALSTIVSQLFVAERGLFDGDRPGLRLLFSGPRGAGKHTAAAAMARARAGTAADGLITVDLAEYLDQHQLSQFFGAPPGYVGFEDTVSVLDQLRKRPYATLVLDNVQQAGVTGLTVMRRILGSGAIQDRHGRKVSLANVVVIAIRDLLNGEENDERAARDASLAEEFDEVVRFEPLTPKALGLILDRELERLNVKLSTSGHATLALSDAARMRLLRESGSVATPAGLLLRLSRLVGATLRDRATEVEPSPGDLVIEAERIDYSNGRSGQFR